MSFCDVSDWALYPTFQDSSALLRMKIPVGGSEGEAHSHCGRPNFVKRYSYKLVGYNNVFIVSRILISMPLTSLMLMFATM